MDILSTVSLESNSKINFDGGDCNYSALSKKSPKNCRNFLMLFKKLSTRQGLSCFVSQ